MLVYVKDGLFTQADKVFTDESGVKHDVKTIEKVWSDVELKSVGLYRVTFKPIEDMSNVIGWEFEKEGDKVYRVPIREYVSYEDALAAEREQMRCSPLQGILTIGEEDWSKVELYRDTEASWSQKKIIDSALDWRRNSQEIQFFQWLLGCTDEQVDDLFRAAMELEIG